MPSQALVPHAIIPLRPAVLRARGTLVRLVDAFESFMSHMQHERQCSPNTILAYRADFLQFVAWLDQTLAVEPQKHVRGLRPNAMMHFTTERIRGWQAHLSLERHNGPSSVRRKLHSLSSFAKYLVRTGAIGRSPLDGVTPPKRRVRVSRGIPLEAWQQLLALPLPPRDDAIRGVFAYAGLRLGEVAGLMAGSLHLGPPQPTLHIRGKGDRERLVPIPPVLQRTLLDYQLGTGRISPRDHVFLTRDGQPMHTSAIGHMVTKWGRRVGMHLHPHMFRHTYATGLAMTGVPIHVLKEWLGHEDIRTTDVYLHHADGAQARQALDAWAGEGYATQHANPPPWDVNH